MKQAGLFRKVIHVPPTDLIVRYFAEHFKSE